MTYGDTIGAIVTRPKSAVTADVMVREKSLIERDAGSGDGSRSTPVSPSQTTNSQTVVGGV
jgi:hypothetical protein